MTSPARRGGKIIGICLNVLAFPIPLNKVNPSIKTRNPGHYSRSDGLVYFVTPIAQTRRPTPLSAVTLGPPSLSLIGPNKRTRPRPRPC